jgi:5-methylthioadenosine/S-adenosylhomocysteine deaminase
MSLLINSGYVVTMDPQRSVLDGGWVLVGDDGKIDAVGPSGTVPAHDGPTIDATRMIVVPGLIDAWQEHGGAFLPPGTSCNIAARSAMAAAMRRGWSATDHSRAATLLCGTLLRGGVTCVAHELPGIADWGICESIIHAFESSGIRHVQVMPLPIDIGMNDSTRMADEAVRRVLPTASQKMQLALGVTTSAVATLQGHAREMATLDAYALALRHGLRLHSRTSVADAEHADDLRASIRSLGRSDVLHLMELGVLDSHWTLLGGAWLTSTDRTLMQESGCAAVCAPLAEAMRGFGTGEWAQLRRMGVPCALGSGPLAQHNVMDMVEQMKACLLVQNATSLDPTAMSAEAVLEMATIDAARALGMQSRIGSLEPGKRGDIALFDLGGVETVAGQKPTSLLVTCAGARDAAWVIVNGRVVVQPQTAQSTDAAGDASAPDLAARLALALKA